MPLQIALDDFTELHDLNPINIEISEAPNKNLSYISNVTVDDYHVIKGEGGKSYVVWAINVTLGESNFSSIRKYKRYTDLERLRERIGNKVGYTNVPSLPPKDSFLIDRLVMSPRWLEVRLKGIQWFLCNIFLNPKLQNLDVVHEFLLN